MANTETVEMVQGGIYTMLIGFAMEGTAIILDRGGIDKNLFDGPYAEDNYVEDLPKGEPGTIWRCMVEYHYSGGTYEYPHEIDWRFDVIEAQLIELPTYTAPTYTHAELGSMYTNGREVVTAIAYSNEGKVRVEIPAWGFRRWIEQADWEKDWKRTERLCDACVHKQGETCGGSGKDLPKALNFDKFDDNCYSYTSHAEKELMDDVDRKERERTAQITSDAR